MCELNEMSICIKSADVVRCNRMYNVGFTIIIIIIKTQLGAIFQHA